MTEKQDMPNELIISKLQAMSSELMLGIMEYIANEFPRLQQEGNNAARNMDYALNITLFATAKLLAARCKAFRIDVNEGTLDYSSRLLELTRDTFNKMDFE